jgi:2'-5' RNA ligase
VPPEQWHVTLRFLGRVDPAEVLVALSSAALPRAEAQLGPRVARLGPGALVLPVSGLGGLAAAVRAATARIGDPPDRREFTGHLTLARLRRGSAGGRAGVGEVVGVPFSARFPVVEVEVVSSVTAATGAVHEVLARFACS